ncbi:MAG TPA: hypothetical protein VH025_08080 [Solirubrobacteraceae bacterium]|nr:hypothetical protein [Solirubrobacteraceae bacterium]
MAKVDTHQAQPTHVKGINEGNAKGNYEKMSGHRADGTSTAERSTGVASTEPVDPSMPNLSPA